MSETLLQASREFLVRYGGDAFPKLFRSAKGTVVTDSDGREYLDFTSGQMCATIGHNHPAIRALNRRCQHRDDALPTSFGHPIVKRSNATVAT